MSRRMCQYFLLILFGIITGSLSASWDMTVSPLVSVLRGEDAVLSCSFTHPGQQDYSGKITVKWRARDSEESFLQCSVKNDSTGGLSDCSIPGFKYSLYGDPRQGVLSLLIRRMQLSDNGAYYCRVELDQKWSNFEKKTNLQVTVKPQILSLSVVEMNPASESATRRLQCEVEGNPLPTITWLSGSTPLSDDQVQTSQSSQPSPYRVMSSIPYPEEQPLFTCRAESELGVAEWRYPASKTLLITLTVCGTIVLLLLTGFIIYCLKHRAPTEKPPEFGNTDRVGADVSPVYENNEVVENHRLQCSEGPAAGDVEPHLYYAVSLQYSTSSQHATFQSSTQPHEDTGIVYSLLNDHR